MRHLDMPYNPPVHYLGFIKGLHSYRPSHWVCIVTGAGRGLGRAIAELYAREGARVVVASRSADGCASVVEAIEAAGGTAIAKPTNVGIKSDVVDMVRFAVESFGSLDILVNSVQSWGTRDEPTGLPVPTPLELFDDAELDWTFDTGFRGTFWAMQAAFPHMRERGGRIINFTSWYGAIGNAGTVGYNITKEAVRSLTRTVGSPCDHRQRRRTGGQDRRRGQHRARQSRGDGGGRRRHSHGAPRRPAP